MASSSQKIFIAGAGGAIGRRLLPQLLAAGYIVFGTSRTRERAAELHALGATPVIVNAFDREGVLRAVREARPEIVMHQMTDLPQTIAAGLSADTLARNARVRTEGGRNLIDAALAAGAQRFVAQSLAWVYAPGQQPHTEADPLDATAVGEAATTVQGVIALERAVLESPQLRGVVLRYGMLWGPGTWNEAPSGNVPVHVDAAAHAALLALQGQHTGIFNIAEEAGLVSAAKAHRELGWRPDFRLSAQR